MKQCDNYFKFLDFLDKKKKFDKMLEEVETYVILLYQNDFYPQIEETYMWLYKHQGLTDAQRQVYGCRIFSIDPHYYPRSVKLEAIFGQLNALNPGSPAMADVAAKALHALENNKCKKEIE